MTNCKFCGQQNADDATYCGGCKRPLPAATAPQPLTGEATPGASQATAPPDACQACGYIFGPFDEVCARCKAPRGATSSPTGSALAPAAYAPGAAVPRTGADIPGSEMREENTSGSGPGSPVPAEIAGGWNWGAFYFQWIWGLNHRTYITLITLGIAVLSGAISAATAGRSSPVNVSVASPLSSLLGLINLGCAIWFGLKGNEWGWQNRRFESVEHFRTVQRTWAWWALGVFVATLILCGLFFTIIMSVFFAGMRGGAPGTPGAPRGF
jgi:hypothetical protein